MTRRKNNPKECESSTCGKSEISDGETFKMMEEVPIAYIPNGRVSQMQNIVELGVDGESYVTFVQ